MRINMVCATSRVTFVAGVDVYHLLTVVLRMQLTSAGVIHVRCAGNLAGRVVTVSEPYEVTSVNGKEGRWRFLHNEKIPNCEDWI